MSVFPCRSSQVAPGHDWQVHLYRHERLISVHIDALVATPITGP